MPCCLGPGPIGLCDRGHAEFPRTLLLGYSVNRGNPLARVDMFSDSGHVSSRKGRGGKDGKRAERTSACWYERTTRRISTIEGATLGPMLRAQASKRGSRSVYPSRRRLRGSLPVVRDDRTPKGQRRRCAACAVGADRTRRAITLTRGASCLWNCNPVYRILVYPHTSTPYVDR